VRFTGFVRDAELKLLYGAADVAVAPSIYEPFGLVAVEAMACGTPVVVGDTGGLREIVADDAGLSVEPQDPDALAAALVRILTEPELAARLVVNGRRRAAARYDWSAVARRTVEIHRQACAEEAALQARLSAADGPTPLRALLRRAPILELDDVS
jgi:glycogen synthase